MYSRIFDTMPPIVPLFLILAFTGVLGSAVSVYGKPFNGVGHKIIDGDSFYVKKAGKKIEIRLYGIDCPEYAQTYSNKAKTFVRRKILHKKLKIIPYYKDAYGRLVVMVKYGEKLLNESLVEAGLAWVYPRYCKKKICRSWKNQEAKARKSVRGLWRDKHPIAPWRWKRDRRK